MLGRVVWFGTKIAISGITALLVSAGVIGGSAAAGYYYGKKTNGKRASGK